MEGLTDHQQIAEKFQAHFAKLSSAAGLDAGNMHSNYESKRLNYVGFPYLQEHKFDAELVENIIVNLTRGKAAGLDGLTAEHLIHCHELLPCVLSKLFNLMMLYGYVPNDFGLSYTVPIQKGDKSCSKSLTVDDFRGISISAVLSKVFELCVLDRFDNYFVTSDNQFGFKKSTGCSHAIYTARSVIDKYVAGGSTVNLCALDISKAFDRMNHKGLFVKLMERNVPNCLLLLIENWFSKCWTCIRWFSVMSPYFKLEIGIRQGGIWSPKFFALYIDSVVKKVNEQKIGCYMHYLCVSVILYADDILILAPTVDCLLKLFIICETELNALGMSINEKKTVCLRVGPDYQAVCANLVTRNGKKLEWVSEVRYLGVYIVSSFKFKCCFDNGKKSYFRSFNAIYGRVGTAASEETVLHLIKSQCIPALTYGLDVCPLIVSDRNSIEFTVTRTLMKVFRTYSKDIIDECRSYFCFPTVQQLVKDRKIAFLRKYVSHSNMLCKMCSDAAVAELNELSLV